MDNAPFLASVTASEGRQSGKKESKCGLEPGEPGFESHI